MKVLIETKNEAKKGDILRFNGVEWENINPHDYLAKIEQNMANLEQQIKHTEDNMQLLVNGVNNKLEEYHKILQLLVKEK